MRVFFLDPEGVILINDKGECTNPEALVQLKRVQQACSRMSRTVLMFTPGQFFCSI